MASGNVLLLVRAPKTTPVGSWIGPQAMSHSNLFSFCQKYAYTVVQRLFCTSSLEAKQNQIFFDCNSLLAVGKELLPPVIYFEINIHPAFNMMNIVKMKVLSLRTETVF